MAGLKTREIARQMDETDLRILKMIVEDYSSVLEFSEKWIRMASDDQDILLCEERLEKLCNFGLIERDDSRTKSEEGAVFFLRHVRLANAVLKEAGMRSVGK